MLEGSLTEFIYAIGYAGLFLVIFAESGFFLAPLLPGDSLLFGAGILASQGYFRIELLIITFILGAVSGNTFGYWFGVKFGKRIFDGTFPYLKPNHLAKTHKFYEEHGAFSITIARFIPVVRTFMPILAGAADMSYRTFLTYNILGAITWSGGLTLLGYFLGNTIPNIERYIIPGVIIIIVLSLIPIVREVLKGKAAKKRHTTHH